MDITGLKASTAWPSLFTGSARVQFPESGLSAAGFDHTLVWRNDRRQYAVTTEPYQHGRPQVKQWASKNGWGAVEVPELGMWHPDGGTTLILLSPPGKGINIQESLSAWGIHLNQPTIETAQ
jgi:hypothetical protein